MARLSADEVCGLSPTSESADGRGMYSRDVEEYFYGAWKSSLICCNSSLPTMPDRSRDVTAENKAALSFEGEI